MAASLRSKLSPKAVSQTIYFVSNRLHIGRSGTGFVDNLSGKTPFRLSSKMGLFFGDFGDKGGNGDPPEFWQPPAGEDVIVGSVITPEVGGGGGGDGVGSNAKDGGWGGANMGNEFPTPKEICNRLDKFVIGQERAKKIWVFGFEGETLEG